MKRHLFTDDGEQSTSQRKNCKQAAKKQQTNEQNNLKKKRQTNTRQNQLYSILLSLLFVASIIFCCGKLNS